MPKKPFHYRLPSFVGELLPTGFDNLRAAERTAAREVARNGYIAMEGPQAAPSDDADDGERKA